MKIAIAAFSICLLVESSAYSGPSKHLLLIGGGGEPAGPSTMFDPDLENFSIFFRNTDWSKSGAFNGGHKTTERLASEVLQKEAPPFSEASLRKEIEQVKEQIAQRKIDSGDQYLILIDSHGALQGKQETHSVAAGLSGTVSLDSLKELRDILESAGVKPAIVDLSCYSGATQALATEKTCVITAATADTPSINGFAIQFSEALSDNYLHNKTTSLEDVFLRARAGATGRRSEIMQDFMTAPTFPLISTRAGKKAEQILRPVRWKLFYDPGLIEESANSGNCYNVFHPGEEVERLISDLDSVFEESQSFSAVYARFLRLISREKGEKFASSAWGVPAMQLKSLVKRYDKSLASVQAAFLEVQRKEKSVTGRLESFASVDNVIHWKLSWAELARLDIEGIKKSWKAQLISPSSEAERKDIEAKLQVLTQVEKRKRDMAAEPKFENLIKTRTKYEESTGELEFYASMIAAQERHVFMEIYNKESGRSDHEACKDFKL